MTCTCSYSQEGMDRRRIRGSSQNCPEHSTTRRVSVIDVWELRNKICEGNYVSLGYFLNKRIVDMLVFDDRYLTKHEAIKLGNKFFLLGKQVLITNDVSAEVEKIKKNALEKLNENERLALGL